MKNVGIKSMGLAGLALSLVTGCDDPIGSVETIDKTRILAAKIEVNGDATRAAPLPGEDVVVRWLVVAPEPDASFAYSFAACVAADSSSDLTTCAGEPLATALSLDPTPEVPTLAFQAPADATGDERLAVLGDVCRSGVGLIDAAESACSDGSQALATTLDFAVDDGTHPNSNPALLGVTLGGSELDPATAQSLDCNELPNIRAGSGPRTLHVELSADSRDPLEQVDPDDPARESLLLSYFVTRGVLDHPYSGIDADAPSVSGSAVWTVESHSSEPKVARFIFVVRDGRGGSDFTERRVCVTP